MNVWNLTAEKPPATAGSAESEALTVTQASRLAKGALKDLSRMTILGEVTGFKGQYGGPRGNCYFQIKDESSALEVMIWSNVYNNRAFDIDNGQQLLLTGTFDVYEKNGKMSFVATSFTLAGEGLLRQQVAELAEKLRREGLMDLSRKRPIPAFCTRIAVVTSLSGSVINDVKRALLRRNPFVEIICVGSLVQGPGAPAELIDALRRAAAIAPTVDCILLVRGGGSYEDLMTFNDEALARAVAASPVPVVTGIGHEPDTSICDMVSDRRSSTPTAAAEEIAPELSQIVQTIDARERRLKSNLADRIAGELGSLAGMRDRMGLAMGGRLERVRLMLEQCATRPCLTSPSYLVERRRGELSIARDRLMMACDRDKGRFRAELDRLAPRITAAPAVLARASHSLSLAVSRLKAEGPKLLGEPRTALGSAAASLEALSPLKVLARGYSIAYDEQGRVATQAASFAQGDELRVRMADGDVMATVTSVKV